MTNGVGRPPPYSVLVSLGNVINQCFARLFSEARAVATMKLAAFTSFLVFVGLGVVVRYFDIGGSDVAEFIVSAPDRFQTIAALIALVFVIVANIYTRIRRQEWEMELLRIAANPNIPSQVRKAILDKLNK